MLRRLALLGLCSWWFYTAPIEHMMYPLRGIDLEKNGPYATMAECEGRAELYERLTHYTKIAARIPGSLIPACVPGEPFGSSTIRVVERVRTH